MRSEIADFEERLRHGDAKDINEPRAHYHTEGGEHIATSPARPDLSNNASAEQDKRVIATDQASFKEGGDARSQRVTGLQRAMILASLKGPDHALYQQQLVVRSREGLQLRFSSRRRESAAPAMLD